MIKFLAERCGTGTVVLEGKERRLACFVERHDLTVYDWLLREPSERLGDRRIPDCEVIVIAQAKVYLATDLMTIARYPSNFSS